MDEYITLELPELDSMGAVNDDDTFMQYLRNKYPKLRDWTFTDPLRTGGANLVHSYFDTSNMENERIQSLIGLNDEQFIEAVRNGRVLRDEWPLGKMPPQERDAILRERLTQRNSWQKGVNAIADAIAPTPHAQPTSWLGKLGYGALELVPDIAASIPQIYALGPWGFAGLSTVRGHNASTEQVYDNLRRQGLSPDEAYEKANALLPNLGDYALRGGVNFATMGLLNKAGNVASQYNPITATNLPITQVLKNITGASGVSGAGAMGEQAFTNYRSDVENNWGDLSKTGLKSAAITGAMGLINAGLNWRNLRELQRQYWENMKPVDASNWWPKSDNNGSAGTGTGRNPTPKDPNSGGDSGTIRVITEDELAAQNEFFNKWNNAATKRGFKPANDLTSWETSTGEVWDAIATGKLNPQEAVALYQESGLPLATSQKIVNDITQFAAQNPDIIALKTQPPTPEPPRQPTEFVFPIDKEWRDPLFTSRKPTTPQGTQPPKLTALAERPTTPEIVTPPPQNPPVTPPSNMWTDPLMLGRIPAIPPNQHTATPPQVQRQPESIVNEHSEPYSVRLEALGNEEYYSDYLGDNSNPTQDIPDTHNPDVATPKITAFSMRPEFLKPNVTHNIGGFSDLLYPDSDNEPYPVIEGLTDEDKAYIENLRKTNPQLADYLESKPSDEELAQYGFRYGENGEYIPIEQRGSSTTTPSSFADRFNPEYDGFIGLIHSGAGDNERELYVFLDGFNGNPFLDIADDKGNSVAVYTPDNDTVSIRPEYHSQGWTRFIEDALRSQILHKDNQVQPVTPAPETPIISASLEGLGTQKTQTQPENSVITEGLKSLSGNNTENVTAPTPKPDTTPKPTANAPLPELENSFKDITNDEKMSRAERNKKALAAFPDEQTMRDSLKKLHVPMLRAMSGLTRSGLKKDDFINSIVQDTLWLKNRPIPEGAKINGEQSANTPQETQSTEPQVQPQQKLKRISLDAVKGVLRNIKSHTLSDYDAISDREANENFDSNQKIIDASNDYDHILDILRATDKTTLAYMLWKKAAELNYPQYYDFYKNIYIPMTKERIIESYVDMLIKTGKVKLTDNLPHENSSQPETQPQETKPDTQESDNAPVIEFSGSDERPLWTVKVKGESYFVAPYAYSVPKFREWMIYPVGYPNSDKSRMYDAYLESFNDNGSDTVAAVEAIKDTITDFYRKKNGETKSDKEAKNDAEKKNNSPIRVNYQPKTQQPQKAPEPDIPTRSEATQSDSPIVRLANRVKERILPVLLDEDAEILPFSNKELFEWAALEFGGTKGEGKFDDRDAYDAMEMGINLAIIEAEITPANAEDTHVAIDDINDLLRILQVIPTQSNRTKEQVAFQQFSTPPTLAYLVNWLASVGSDNIALEPSAGTGNLAVFAYNGGAGLILNEIGQRRANILHALNLGNVYREDALNIADILIPKLDEDELPDRVIMNPPFSAAGKQGTANSNKNGYKHVEQALQLLKDGGRLVAILGAGRDGTAQTHDKWIKHIAKTYNVRAVITSGGKAFQKFGTTFGNVILVIDKGKTTPKNSTIRYNFSGNFDDDVELQKLFDALTAIHNEALGDDFVPFKKSDEAESLDDMLRHLANRQLVLENLDDVEENTEQYSVNPAVRDIIAKITKNAPKDKKFPTSLIVQEAKNKGINIAEVAHSINALQDYGEIRTYYDPNYDGEDFDLNHGILFKLTDTSLQSGNDEPDNDSTPPKPEPTKPKPTPETPSKGKHEPVTQEAKQDIPENINNSTARKAINEAEEILSMLHNASFDELRNIAEFLDINIHPLVDSSNGNGDILSDKLRAAIKKKLQPEISQENPKQVKPTESTPQVQETPKPDTQRKPKKEYTPLDEDSPEPESASIYADYVPEDHSNISLFKLAKPHPSKLVETTNMKAVHLPPLTYSPNLPENMIKSGAISASQLEAVAYAGQAFSQTLPSGQTKGFILGDGTGSGKGRTIAAIISDQLNQKHGNGKAVWFSVSADLFKDAQRDTEGIGGNKKDVFELADTKLDATIPADKKGILFTTYMTLITTGQKKQNDNEEEIPSGGIIDKKRLQQIIDWLGADFDGVIAFDECHKINNLGGQDTGFGKSKPSQAADAARMLADALPNARILYVSATSATDPANLRMFDRAGLWGEGTPFHNADQFAEEIRAGGPNAMEMFARDAKALGVFMARSLSWDGVTYRRLTYNLSPTERDMYNEVAQAWRIVDDALSQGFTTVGGDANAGKAILNRDFRREQLQCFNFLLTAFKTNALIQDAQKQLEAGNSIVIQIDSTYDAFINRILKGLKPGEDLRDVVISPVEDLIGFVMDKFPVVKMEQVQDERPNGDTYIQNVIVRDSNGNPVISQEAVKLRDKLIAHLKRVRFNMSPLDNIINSLGGINNVAEVTRRKHRLIQQSDGKIIDAKQPPSANKEIDAFINGEKRVIIFSRAGNTGRSFHADKSFKNTQKRIHYLLEGGFSAFNAIQGFGRTHRSNELYPPEYVVVAVDIPGEIRFISAIVRKLGQMGALTAGDRKNNTQGLYSEKDNMDSNLAQSAMTTVLGNLLRNAYKEFPNGREIFRQMGFNPDDKEKLKDIPLKRVFNRILSLDLNMQDILISYFTMEHEQRLMLAIQNGTADIGTENVRALDLDTVQDTVILEDKAKGIKTKYLELKVKVKSRIRPFENVTEKNHCREFFTDQDGNIYAARQNGEYDENGDLIRAVLTHTADGEPIEQFTLFTPDFLTSYASDRLALSNKKKNQKRRFTPVTPERAKELWQEQSSAIAKSHIEHIHMISGVLLPVWQKLKQLKSSRVKRVIAPDGSSIIGRIVENSEVQGVLSSFNIRYHGESFSVQDVLNQIQKPKTIARLFNNWKLKYSTVSGEKRIEILYNDYHDIPELEKAGALIEIIGSNERAFIPIGNNDVLQKIIDAHNVTNFENTQTADDILDEAAEKINSNIPDSSKLYFIHPSFSGLFNFGDNQDDNPYIHESPYASPNSEFEKRYQASKKTEEKKSMWGHIKDFALQIVKGRNDIPELAGDNWKNLFAVDKNLIDAQEWIRGFKRERQANLHETEKILRAILLDIKNPDDFDLFQRAMELQDLHETRNLDINARMPWALNPETLYDFDANDPLDEEYSRIMAFVRNNSRVQGAMAKADILMSDLRQRLISEADRLGMHDLRDKLKRKHYFRHLVLEYYNMQRSGQPHPTFKNPDRRGYTQHREGSDKNISSNWILAMGEVMIRMTDDIKILQTLGKLRKRYDKIEELKQQAFSENMKNAVGEIMRDLKDIPDELRRKNAEDVLHKKLNARQSRAMSTLFKLAANGDLPVGDNNEWQDLAGRMANAGQLEALSREEQQKLSRYIGWLSSLADKTKARTAARKFLTGHKGKNAVLKDILGDKYIDWRDCTMNCV